MKVVQCYLEMSAAVTATATAPSAGRIMSSPEFCANWNLHDHVCQDTASPMKRRAEYCGINKHWCLQCRPQRQERAGRSSCSYASRNNDLNSASLRPKHLSLCCNTLQPRKTGTHKVPFSSWTTRNKRSNWNACAPTQAPETLKAGE